jgi:hypothetical protein
MNLGVAPVTAGWVIAMAIMLITIVLMIVGQVPIVLGCLIAGVALARLL